MDLQGGMGFRNQGMEAVREAVAFDDDGKWEQAVDKYTKGLEYFMTSLKYEKNERTNEMVKQRMGQYMTRCENLKQMLADGQSPPPKITPTSGTAQVKKPDKKAGGAAGSEADKMKEALSESIQMETPDVPWDAVAGLEKAKNALKEAVILPQQYPQLFRGARQPWRGVLLYGPPGTGKSYLAKALATEAQCTFFSVSSSDLVSKWVGESEKLVRNLFELARERKPSIIFIDEIDSLCSERGGESESESARRIKTEFLVQMDGVGKDQTKVLLLGATNYPWGLDQAIRRRFEKRIYIPLPDLEARKAMFMIQTRKQEACEMTPEDFEEYARRTEGFSGSDIKIVVREALMEPIRTLTLASHFKRVTATDMEGRLRDDMWQRCAPTDDGASPMKFHEVPPEQLAEPPLTPTDFEAVIGGARSSVSPEDLIPFDKWTEQYGQDGSGASGQRGEDDVGEFVARDAATAAAMARSEGGSVGGEGAGSGPASSTEGLGMLLAQLATCLPDAMRVAELEQRVGHLERQLQYAVSRGDGSGSGGGGAVAEGEPPADILPPS